MTAAERKKKHADAREYERWLNIRHAVTERPCGGGVQINRAKGRARE